MEREHDVSARPEAGAEWSEKIREFIGRYREDIFEDIGRLVAIPSTEGPAEPGAPFGRGPRQALDQALETARGWGLSVGHQDYKMGWAELPGERPEYLATITHLDVVPAGEGWDGDPFVMRRREGWLLGRGVADDKGASVLCLYALRFLKEAGLPLRYGVRALLGCNEETGMEDVPAYLGQNPAPVFCFSPDASFPVCNGEKGHCGLEMIGGPFPEGRILDWEGGVATNAVPDRASALVKADLKALPQREGVTLEQEGEYVRVRGWGKSGHAAMPEGTVNAIWLVGSYLLEQGLCTPEEKAYLEALEKLHRSTDGSGLGIAACDGRFDPLTVIGGTMKKMADGRFVQTLDIRYPTNTNGKKLAEDIRQTVGDGARVELKEDAEPFYIEADAAPIRALIDTYNQVTGSDEAPFTMGGGTYARHFPLAVSFGPEYPKLQLPAFGGPMHGANEAAPEEGLLQALEIYILALIRLQQLEF